MPGDIEPRIADRKAKCKKIGAIALPFIIVEVQDDTVVKNVYVSVQENVYIVPSVLKALDVCFKVFHVLQLKYPLECEHLWLFIQLGIYQIQTKFDNKIPSLIDIVHKVNL